MAMNPIENKAKPHPKAAVLYSQPAAGTVPMENRWGGNKPLNVMQVPGKSGIFLTPWHITPEAIALLTETDGRCFMVVTLDLNVQGHPAMSVSVQPYMNVTAEEWTKQHGKLLVGQALKQATVAKVRPKKLIVPDNVALDKRKR